MKQKPFSSKWGSASPRHPKWKVGIWSLALGAVFGLGASAPTAVNAADLQAAPGMPRYEAPLARRWSCYFGVFGEGIVSHPELTNVPVAGAITEFTAWGGRGGGLIGCEVLFATGAFVGVEGTAAYGSLPGKWGAVFETDMPLEATLRIRLGYMLDAGLAAYVAGGPAIAQLKTRDALGLTENSEILGGQIAAGLEYYFAPNWRVRGEYAYTYYGSDSVIMSGFPLARLNPTTHAVRLGVIWGF